jgi:hypothetical protein
VAYDEAMPTPGPGGNTVSTMPAWEAYWVAGLGGASYVMAGRGGELAPSINSASRTVSTATGAAFVRGFYVSNTAGVYTASVPAASAADRVDRLVLRLDRSQTTAADWLKPIIVQGSSGSASPPALQTSDTSLYDLPICRWTTKANGTLTGLVDERYKTGGGFLTFTSSARPAASPPRIGFETDTGQAMYANGSSWIPLLPDTGYSNLPISGNWKVGGYQPQLRLLNGWVYLRGSVERTTNTLQSTDTNSPIGTIPAGYRPAGTHNWSSVTSDMHHVRFQVAYDTGALAIVSLSADFGVGHVTYLDTSWPV